MVKRCCIQHCNSTYNIDEHSVSLFRVPKNPVALAKWRNAIPYTSKRLNFVCEKHFQDGQVKKEVKIVDRNGKVLLQKRLMKIRLVTGAVPSIFPVRPEDSSTRRVSPTVEHIKTTMVTTSVATDECQAPAIKNEIQKPENTEETHSEPEDRMEPINEIESKRLFNDIYMGNINPILPNKKWAIHNCQWPERTIAVCEIGITFNDTNAPPLFTKQIVFDEELNFKVFIYNKWIPLWDHEPTTTQPLLEFESLISDIDCITICAGGPNVDEYKNINPECAYKDPTCKWRHNLCTLQTSGTNICKSCVSLDKILQRHIDRKKSVIARPHKSVRVLRKKKK